jgi:hypothetical protein
MLKSGKWVEGSRPDVEIDRNVVRYIEQRVLQLSTMTSTKDIGTI